MAVKVIQCRRADLEPDEGAWGVGGGEWGEWVGGVSRGSVGYCSTCSVGEGAVGDKNDASSREGGRGRVGGGVVGESE